jgi:hypothetical protein
MDRFYHPSGQLLPFLSFEQQPLSHRFLFQEARGSDQKSRQYA